MGSYLLSLWNLVRGVTFAVLLLITSIVATLTYQLYPLVFFDPARFRTIADHLLATWILNCVVSKLITNIPVRVILLGGNVKSHSF